MAKQVAKADISSFVKGLVTESSPLNFPPDASRDEENFDLNIDGSRSRRLGLDFESSYQLHSTGYTTETIPGIAFSSFKWFGAGNDPDAEFIVVQIGAHIDVYRTLQDSISSTGYLGSVEIPGIQGSQLFSYASIDGRLVIASGTHDIHIIEWDGTTFTHSTNSLLIRDLWGLPDYDNNDLTYRPPFLTDAHLYNLRNQGWGIPRKNASAILVDPIAEFSGLGGFPSNVETVYSGLQFQAGPSPYERMYINLYDEVLGLSDRAAKGYFIIDALMRGTSRASVEANNRTKYPELVYAVSNFNADSSSGGCSLVTEFAGRVFFAGFTGTITEPEDNSPNLANYVLFSQVVRSKDDIIKCYQAGDPTSKEGSDIVDTDGGFIRLSGAKKIVGMRVLSNTLIVITDNGVWKISGGSDYGFTATNYRVDKLSTSGGISDRTIIDVNDEMFFFGQEGIFRIKKDQFGDFKCENISKTTIQSLYDEIPTEDRDNAIGVYDSSEKKIRWLYGVSSNLSLDNTVRELIFDLNLGSFTKTRIYNLATGSPKAVGYIRTPLTNLSSESESTYVDNVPIIVGANDVIVNVPLRLPRITTVKFITLYSTVGGNVGYTFSQFKEEDFRDWKTADGIGVDAFAYILTGTTTAGDSSVYKQTPYIVMHFLKTEDGVVSSGGELIPAKQSSCLMRSMWNWATSAVSGNWGNIFQAYRYRRPLFITGPSDPYDNGFETVVTKNKLRGRGRALSLYFETEPYKDCKILGWNLSLTGNNLP